MSSGFSHFTTRVARLPRPIKYAVYVFPIFVGGRAMSFVVQNYIAADEATALKKTVDESHIRSTLFGVPVKAIHADVSKGEDGAYTTDDDAAMAAHWYKQEGEVRRQLVGYAPSK